MKMINLATGTGTGTGVMWTWHSCTLEKEAR
jgi:hypothetical protein